MFTTDLMGRAVNPEGRTLLVDRRTPAEIEHRRQQVKASATSFISERKAAEERDWKTKEARARKAANEEWEREESERHDQLEHQVVGRLLEEIKQVEDSKNQIRATLGLQPTYVAEE